MKNLSIQYKIAVLVSICLIMLGTILTYISVSSAKESLLSAELNKLTAVQTSKKAEVENYFS